jgi:hypothetical protein
MWRHFADSINALYGKEVCNTKSGVCKFDEACSLVDKSIDITMTFLVKKCREESCDSVPFVIPTRNMLLEGTYFGDANLHSCYIPVLDSGIGTGREQWNVYVGNIFLQDYYIVFSDHNDV